MRKKLLAILMILLMLVTAFAGCSGNDSGRSDREEREESRDDDDDEDEDVDLESVFGQMFGKDDHDDRDDDDDDIGLGGFIGKKEEKVINVMSFTDEVPRMVQMYLDMHPELGYTMKSTIVATTDSMYQPVLDEMLRSGGEDAPDIYALEGAFVVKYTQGDASSFAATYDDLGIRTDRMIQESKTATYAVEVGTRPRDGEVVALPYQGTGGCFIYRRSIAKAVWGTDDPAVIQRKIGGASGNWDSFWGAAEELKARGYAIVSGDGDIWHAMENSADNGWIVDNELYLDPKREALLDVSKKLKDNNYHNETQDWQFGWFDDMVGYGPKEVFGYFGPAWFVNYTLEQNCGDNEDTYAYEGTYGDWAVCNSPIGFYWGGTWIAASKDVVKKEKKDVVADIIQWITLDYDENSLQYMWANGTFNPYSGKKDVVVSGAVMEKSDGCVDMLGGQNMFEYYIPANDYATGRNVTAYDEVINGEWRDAVRRYVSGEENRSEAIAGFASAVRSKIGINIPEKFYTWDNGSGDEYRDDYNFGFDTGFVTPTQAPVATPIPNWDLGGIEIVVGNWYSPEGEEPIYNAYEEATARYRQEIFAKYNFTLDKKAVTDWGSMEDMYVDSVKTGDPAAHVFELDYRFISKPLSEGLFYDLATLSPLDFTEERWNDSVRTLMTRGNRIYGMSPEANSPGGGLIWNKRLFEEAGLDPHLPYDMQVTGEWTWDAFMDICDILTRDIDGDGATDVYALTGDSAEIVRCLVASTGEDFFTKDEYGNLYNNMSSDAVLRAMEYATELYEAGYVMPQPEESNWDYYVDAFQNGKAAMTFSEEYRCEPNQAYGDYMEDEVGYVLPPKPEYGAPYHSYVNNSVYVIPVCYDAETATRIAFAFNVYTMATPGYDDPRDWLEQYYAHFGDERAVDETIACFGNSDQVFYPLDALVSENNKLENDLLWKYPFVTETPKERVEEIRESWDQILAEVNAY